MVRKRVIVQANDRLCEMTGHRPEVLLQQSARMLYPTREGIQFQGLLRYDGARPLTLSIAATSRTFKE
ncbi:MAG: hypothetical protein JJV98_01525 [Desulfosarcina sp.]|nr:hypothetical protein [Desulfobacterales bacterium]